MSKKFVHDWIERILRSFFGGVVAAATLAFTPGGANITSVRALFIGCVCGGISAVLGLLSRHLGSPDSAGTA